MLENLRCFAEAVKQQGVHLRHAFLFGSYARGEQRDDSDVDVALVADEFVGVSFEDIKRFIDVTIQPPYYLFEVHTFNTADFDNGHPFLDEIKRTGIAIA